MPDPYLFTVTNNVATFSINDAPWNLMSLEYIDRLEEQLPDVLGDDDMRAFMEKRKPVFNQQIGSQKQRNPH